MEEQLSLLWICRFCIVWDWLGGTQKEMVSKILKHPDVPDTGRWSENPLKVIVDSARRFAQEWKTCTKEEEAACRRIAADVLAPVRRTIVVGVVPLPYAARNLRSALYRHRTSREAYDQLLREHGYDKKTSWGFEGLTTDRLALQVETWSNFSSSSSSSADLASLFEAARDIGLRGFRELDPENPSSDDGLRTCRRAWCRFFDAYFERPRSDELWRGMDCLPAALRELFAFLKLVFPARAGRARCSRDSSLLYDAANVLLSLPNDGGFLAGDFSEACELCENTEPPFEEDVVPWAPSVAAAQREARSCLPGPFGEPGMGFYFHLLSYGVAETQDASKGECIVEMRAYGVTEDGRDVCARLTGFDPGFYLQMPDNYGEKETEEFVAWLDGALADKLCSRYERYEAGAKRRKAEETEAASRAAFASSLPYVLCDYLANAGYWGLGTEDELAYAESAEMSQIKKLLDAASDGRLREGGVAVARLRYLRARCAQGFDPQASERFVRVDVRYPGWVKMARELIAEEQRQPETSYPKALWPTDERWPSLERVSHRIFEANVDFTKAWLFGTGKSVTKWARLTSGTEVLPRDPERVSRCHLEYVCPWQDAKRAYDLDLVSPQMRGAAFDLEVLNNGTFPYPSDARWAIIFASLTLFTVGKSDAKTIGLTLHRLPSPKEGDPPRKNLDAIREHDTEKALVSDLLDLFRDSHVDYVLAHNGNWFDWQYLLARARKLGLTDAPRRLPKRLGARMVCDSERTHKGQNKVSWKVEGAVVMDTLLYFASGQAGLLKHLGLGALAFKFLKGDTKEEFHHSRIAELFDSPEGRAAVAEYGAKDALLVYRLAQKCNIVPKMLEYSALCGIPVDDAVNRGPSYHIDSVVVSANRAEGLKRDGAPYLVPTFLDDGGCCDPSWDELDVLRICEMRGTADPFSIHPPGTFSREKQGKAEKYGGALVLPPVVGYYRSLTGYVDWQSLYPSIIGDRNYSLELWLSRDAERRIDPELASLACGQPRYRFMEGSRTIEETEDPESLKFMPASFRDGILAVTQASIMSKRSEVKKQMKIYRAFASAWSALAAAAKAGDAAAAEVALDDADAKLRKLDAPFDSRSWRNGICVLPEDKDTADYASSLCASRAAAVREAIAREGPERWNEILRLYAGFDPEFAAFLADMRQQALKLVGNSIYGFMGQDAKQLSDVNLITWHKRRERGGMDRVKRVAAYVTYRGKYALKRIQYHVETEFVEKKGWPFDARVVYGDTDSMQIRLVGFEGTWQEALEHVEKMAASCTMLFAHSDGTKSPMVLKVEGVFDVLLLMRKKTYVGHLYNAESLAWEEVFKGNIGKNRNSPPWIKLWAERIVKALMEPVVPGEDPTAPVERAFSLARECVDELVKDKVSYHDLAVSTKLGKALPKYDSNVRIPHVALARRKKKRGEHVAAGSLLSMVYCALTADGSAGYRKTDDVEDFAVAEAMKLPVRKKSYLDKFHSLILPLLGIASGDLPPECSRDRRSYDVNAKKPKTGTSAKGGGTKKVVRVSRLSASSPMARYFVSVDPSSGIRKPTDEDYEFDPDREEEKKALKDWPFLKTRLKLYEGKPSPALQSSPLSAASPLARSFSVVSKCAACKKAVVSDDSAFCEECAATGENLRAIHDATKELARSGKELSEVEKACVSCLGGSEDIYVCSAHDCPRWPKRAKLRRDFDASASLFVRIRPDRRRALEKLLPSETSDGIKGKRPRSFFDQEASRASLADLLRGLKLNMDGTFASGAAGVYSGPVAEERMECVRSVA